jgi:hypothetical protein
MAHRSSGREPQRELKQPPWQREDEIKKGADEDEAIRVCLARGSW